MNLFTVVLLVAIAYVTVVPAVRALRGGPGRGGMGLEDRAGAVAGVASTVAGAVAARQLLPWEALPTALWTLPVAAVVAAAVGAVPSWRRLPGLSRPPGRRAVAVGVEVLVDIALVVIMLVV